MLIGGACVFSHAPPSAPPKSAPPRPSPPPREAKTVLGAGAKPAPSSLHSLTLIADRDDDDADDKADADADVVAPAARVDLVTLDARYTGATLTPRSGGGSARVLVNGKVLAWGERLPAGAQVQGLTTGHASVAV